MVIHKSFIGILVLIIIGGLLIGRVYSADIKIGWVDMRKAAEESNAGKEAKKMLTEQAEKLQRLANEKGKELQDMKESLDKQGLMLDPGVRAAREKYLQTKLRDYQRWSEDVQKDLDQKRIQMETNVSSGLLKVVQEIGAKEGYTIILNNQSIVLFGSKFTDLTDLVIKAYDMKKK